MTIKDNCDQWIRLAYDEWLQKAREIQRSYLRVSTKNLVMRMQVASRDLNRSEEAWNLLERLKRLSDNFNKLEDVSKIEDFKYERPETYLECALTAYRMGDLQEAIRLFQIPVGEFPIRSLHRAISYWLFGCIQWQLPAHLEDAVISWERSLYILQEAQSDNRNNASTKGWCVELTRIMQSAINEATRLNSPPAPPSLGIPIRRARSEIEQYRTKLRSFPVIGSIPAGTPLEMVVQTNDRLETEILDIYDNQYICYSLRGERGINIQVMKDYYLLKVAGNSMNMATPVNIDDGDFVLVLNQNVANNGDIVAVEIIREDHEATLKRYRFYNGHHVLQPESNDPNFQQKMLMKNEFLIRGVALAVLKPL